MNITHNNISKAHSNQKLSNRNTGCTCAVNYHTQLSHGFSGHLHCIQKSCSHNNRCSMLIIVEHRNIANLFQLLLNFKAARRRNILQIDSAEALRNQSNRIHNRIYILGIHA